MSSYILEVPSSDLPDGKVAIDIQVTIDRDRPGYEKTRVLKVKGKEMDADCGLSRLLTNTTNEGGNYGLFDKTESLYRGDLSIRCAFDYRLSLTKVENADEFFTELKRRVEWVHEEFEKQYPSMHSSAGGTLVVDCPFGASRNKDSRNLL